MQPDRDWDPFEGATGYHRIAVDVMCVLCSADPRRIVLNLPNRGAVSGLDLEPARGLMFSVKAYERFVFTPRGGNVTGRGAANLGLGSPLGTPFYAA
jgi:hypothetical protein